MSKYALNLSADNRILSATFAKYALVDAVLVDELPDGNIADYLYQNGEYIYSPIPTPQPTPSQLREQAYNTETIISWDGDMITVTQAAQLWQYYAAEGSEKATELQALIAEAKATIREKYPD